MHICFFSMFTGPDKSNPYTNRLSFLGATYSYDSSQWVPMVAEKLLMSSEATTHHALMVNGADIMIEATANGGTKRQERVPYHAIQ